VGEKVLSELLGLGAMGGQPGLWRDNSTWRRLQGAL